MLTGGVMGGISIYIYIYWCRFLKHEVVGLYEGSNHLGPISNRGQMIANVNHSPLTFCCCSLNEQHSYSAIVYMLPYRLN